MITVTLKEGEKRILRARLERQSGSGAASLSSPEYRVLSAANAVIYDWAAATWTAASAEISALFDGAAAGLTAPGTYYFWMRGVVGLELYKSVHKVIVEEAGP